MWKHFEIIFEITTGRTGKSRPGGTKEQQDDTGKKTTSAEVGAAEGEEREGRAVNISHKA